MSFTLAPWRFWEHKNIQVTSRGPRTDMWGVCVPATGGNILTGASREDAALIAAAPDLYTALDELVRQTRQWSRPRDVTGEALEAAMTALEKAQNPSKGGQE